MDSPPRASERARTLADAVGTCHDLPTHESLCYSLCHPRLFPPRSTPSQLSRPVAPTSTPCTAGRIATHSLLPPPTSAPPTPIPSPWCGGRSRHSSDQVGHGSLEERPHRHSDERPTTTPAAATPASISAATATAVVAGVIYMTPPPPLPPPIPVPMAVSPKAINGQRQRGGGGVGQGGGRDKGGSQE